MPTPAELTALQSSRKRRPGQPRTRWRVPEPTCECCGYVVPHHLACDLLDTLGPVDVSEHIGQPAGRVWWAIEHCEKCKDAAQAELRKFTAALAPQETKR